MPAFGPSLTRDIMQWSIAWLIQEVGHAYCTRGVLKLIIPPEYESLPAVYDPSSLASLTHLSISCLDLDGSNLTSQTVHTA